MAEILPLLWRNTSTGVSNYRFRFKAELAQTPQQQLDSPELRVSFFVNSSGLPKNPPSLKKTVKSGQNLMAARPPVLAKMTNGFDFTATQAEKNCENWTPIPSTENGTPHSGTSSPILMTILYSLWGKTLRLRKPLLNDLARSGELSRH